MATAPTKPYVVRVEWIDGTEHTYEVRNHIETDTTMTLFLNDTRRRERVIPFSNVKEFDIDRGD